MPPSNTAAIFWLKNRRPKLWRDKIDHGHEGKVVIIIDREDAGA